MAHTHPVECVGFLGNDRNFYQMWIRYSLNLTDDLTDNLINILHLKKLAYLNLIGRRKSWVTQVNKVAAALSETREKWWELKFWVLNISCRRGKFFTWTFRDNHKSMLGSPNAHHSALVETKVLLKCQPGGQNILNCPLGSQNVLWTAHWIPS